MIDLAALEADPPGRLAWVAATDELPAGAQARLDATFTWRDGTGADVVGRGRIWLPETASPAGRAPLLHAAGYEVFADGAVPWLQAGFVVATLVTPDPEVLGTGANPISRGLNLDVSFLHAVRLASFVDDARVFVSGGSAGGYMTLMLAAETFPLAGAIAEVPVVNLGYTTAFWLGNAEVATATRDDGTPVMPYLGLVKALGDEACALYGPDPNAEVFLTHSPIGHLGRITCPVATCFSTADDLVPFDQVRPLSDEVLAAVTSGLRYRAEDLCPPGPGRRRLLEALDPALVDLVTEAVPEGLPLRIEVDPADPPRHVIPGLSSDRRWSVTVVDEGGPDEDVPHYRYHFGVDQTAFRQRRLAEPIAVDQLDEAKLDLLLDRWSGREWMAGGPPMLDTPEAERADVARGLGTYCATSHGHAQRFRDLYESLPSDRQVLDPDVVERLGV